MKYITIYPCWVIDEIKNGKTGYVLDRKMKRISIVNDACITDVIRAVESEERGRYEFWSEEEAENG